jgi:antitoxin (DNA-binding transcriptional repressor) of toxin-antitoxin stability system
VGVVEAKARLSELIERVGRGERIFVARRGGPAAVFAPPGAVTDQAGRPHGLATLAGVLADRAEMERAMDEVVQSRRSARERRVPDLR